MWRVDADRSRRIRRNGVVVGARVVLVDPDDGDAPEAVLHWDRPPGQSGAEFRAMLLGAGTVAAPEGEVGAWLAHLNAQPDTEEPLQ